MGADVRMPYKKLGAWLNRSVDTVYQAATDGFVTGELTKDFGGAEDMQILTDSDNPPTTKRQRTKGINTGADGAFSLGCPVKKNDYWKVCCNL